MPLTEGPVLSKPAPQLNDVNSEAVQGGKCRDSSPAEEAVELFAAPLLKRLF